MSAKGGQSRLNQYGRHHEDIVTVQYIVSWSSWYDA